MRQVYGWIGCRRGTHRMDPPRALRGCDRPRADPRRDRARRLHRDHRGRDRRRPDRRLHRDRARHRPDQGLLRPRYVADRDRRLGPAAARHQRDRRAPPLLIPPLRPSRRSCLPGMADRSGPANEDPARRRRRPFPARLFGAGARSASSVASAVGVDRTIQAATEEAIVRAVESPAVERALTRVLSGPVVEQATEDVLRSPAVEQALVEALDSELVDRIWERVLASDETQRLIERIAEAPELRAAIAAQGAGLLADV